MNDRSNISQVELPSVGFLRLKQIQKFIPVSSSTWWKGISDGIYPQPVRLSPRTTAWRVEDIRELIAQLSSCDHSQR